MLDVTVLLLVCFVVDDLLVVVLERGEQIDLFEEVGVEVGEVVVMLVLLGDLVDEKVMLVIGDALGMLVLTGEIVGEGSMLDLGDIVDGGAVGILVMSGVLIGAVGVEVGDAVIGQLVTGVQGARCLLEVIGVANAGLLTNDGMLRDLYIRLLGQS